MNQKQPQDGVQKNMQREYAQKQLMPKPIGQQPPLQPGIGGMQQNALQTPPPQNPLQPGAQSDFNRMNAQQASLAQAERMGATKANQQIDALPANRPSIYNPAWGRGV